MMRAAGRLWCTDVERDSIRSERRFQRLLDAGVYGFSVGSERDARYVLAMLDACKPYADYLVACEAPVRSRIMHPNFAVSLPRSTRGMRGFRNAIASGTNAVLSASAVPQAAHAYITGLQRRHRNGFPLFIVRAVFAFDHLSDADIAAFDSFFATSDAFAEMRLRGARLPLLVSRHSAAAHVMTALPCNRVLSGAQALVA
jgi:hypothetical protein